MNSKIKKAALRILLLQEDFTKLELGEAVGFLSGKTETDLMAYLSVKGTGKKEKRDQSVDFENQRSMALISIEENDPDKYALLFDFEKRVRRGDLLPRLDALKKIGATFSKDFEAGKSRREAIPRLMSLLVDRPINELRNLIQGIVRESGNTNSEYSDLANFIINGVAGKDT